MIDKWSYKVVDVKGGFLRIPKAVAIQSELDRHGSQGWELVNLVHVLGSRYPQLIFKRPG
jgi:hypothetical protein